MPTPLYLQDSFSGGINQFDDSTKLKPEEYFLLINGRVRNNRIETIKLPQVINDIPQGKLQGIYAAAPFLVAFVDGKAYIKNYFTNSNYGVIPNLQLSPLVDFIYFQLLPASTVNFKRTKTTDSAFSTNFNPNISLTTNINGSPQCALVQDGVSQPWIIFADGSVRVTQNYDQWSLEKPEYVPIGTLMMYHGSILYLVGKDLNGRYTQIFRSISGRPLDFMIIVTPEGLKTSGDEQVGGAPQISHRVSYDEITSISNINSNDGSFFVSTLNSSWRVKPNLTRLIFGEPTFDNLPLFPTGPLNNFSLSDNLGDTTFIDVDGIKSFNAVLQTENESKLDPFSIKINSFFNNIIQNITASVNFDLYIFFAVETVYGPGVVVYDTTRQVFVSLDLYPLVGLIKQFQFLRFRNIRKLFFITTDNKLYEAFSSDSVTANCRFVTKEYITGDPSYEQFINKIRLIFTDVEEDGIVRLTTYTDRFSKDSQIRWLIKNFVDTLEGDIKTIPYGNNQNNQQTVTFSIDDHNLGYKVSQMIEFNSKAKLCYISSNPESKEASRETNESSLIENADIVNDDIICFIGENGADNANHAAVAQMIKDEEPIAIVGLGGHNYPVGDVTTLPDTISKYWEEYKDRLIWSLGAVDLTTLKGKAFLNYFNYPAQKQRYYSKLVGNYTEIFILNAGYNTLGAFDLEPDGITENSKQMEWLRNSLAASDRPFKPVIINAPPFTNQSVFWNGFESLRLPFKFWGASLLLSARSRVYERFRINDFIYIVNGLGGSGIDDFFINDALNPEISGTLVKYNRNYGYLSAVVSKFNVVFKFKSIVSNDIVDTFTINL